MNEKTGLKQQKGKEFEQKKKNTVVQEIRRIWKNSTGAKM